jgi:hypothetical protein
VADTVNKDQAKCIDTMNKNLRKLTKTLAKDFRACIKNAGKGKTDKLGPGGTAETCLTADVKGKVAKTESKLISDYATKCTDLPPFAISDPNDVITAAWQKEMQLIADIFGPDLDGAVVLANKEVPGSKDAAKCQDAVIKAVGKCQDARMNTFRLCKKFAFKGKMGPPPENVGELQAACLAFDGVWDEKGKIAKMCDQKLSEDLDKKCAGLDTDTLFPGCAGQNLATCLQDAVACRSCLAIQEADGLLATACEGCDLLPSEPMGTAYFNYVHPDTCHYPFLSEYEGTPCEDDVFNLDCPVDNSDPMYPDFRGDCFSPSHAEWFISACAPPYAQGTTDCSFHGIASSSSATVIRFDFGNLDPNTGTAPLEAHLNRVSLVDMGVLGAACLYDGESFPACTGGMIDCDGGTGLDVMGEHNHTVGTCGLSDDPNADPSTYTGPSDCEALCESYCTSVGKQVHNPGCGGYCRDGVFDGHMCRLDLECVVTDPNSGLLDMDASGECVGPEPADPHTNNCQCQCMGIGGAPSRPGGMYFHLPVITSVEADKPCDLLDVTMSTNSCVSHTTETLTNVIHEMNLDPGHIDLWVPPVTGPAPATCAALLAGDINGMEIQANNWSLDGGLGDMNMPIVIVANGGDPNSP